MRQRVDAASGRRWTGRASFARLAVVSSIILALGDPALACRGWRGWSTGEDVGKLRAGEFVVTARLVEAFKSEKPIPSIAGNPYGMIYFVEITGVGGGPGATAEVLRMVGTQIVVHLRPSVCESYVPDNFGAGSVRSLVLTKGNAGLFELVGGH